MRPKAQHLGSASSPAGLRPSIQALAARKGAYVIVSSKDSTTDSMLDERRAAMATAVADLDNREDLHLDFYDSQRLATWVSDFPGEILWLRARIGQPLQGWQPFGNWSRAPSDAEPEYFIDDRARLRDMSASRTDPLPIAEGIARLRHLLAQPGGVVRLTGLSGTGKTRLLEALFDPTIGDRPLDPSWAVYADIGHEAPQPSVGQLAEQLKAEGKRALLLLDNCPRETHDAIAPVCRAPNSTVSLITVDLDIQDERPEGTEVFRLQGASQEVMNDLLGRRFPLLPQAVRRRIAELSDGNARVALLIAESARHDAADANLADLGDEALFQRLFRQRDGANEELLRTAEVLSLVYSFDGETTQGTGAELPLLAQVGGLDVRTLLRATDQLGRREIVQSRGRWRALLPQPLANWLAKRALAGIPAIEIAEGFKRHGRLLSSFAHRLSYLHDCPEAQRIATAWLRGDGPLSDLRPIVESYDVLQMNVVAYLAPVAPDAVLDLIEQFVNEREPDGLRARQLPQRGRLMMLLRHLAWFPEHFRRAALTMACIVQAELGTDTRTQDTRHLEELFWPLLSGTTASPQERIAVLEELLSAPEEPDRRLGLIALRGMLETGDFHSVHDTSFGSRPIDYGWCPRNAEDCRAWFGGALAIARQLALSDTAEGTVARSMLADAFRGLWSEGYVQDQLEQVTLDIIAADHWPEGWLAVRKTLALDAKNMEPGFVSRLELLRQRLAPGDLDARLRTYVLVPAHEIADLAFWEKKPEPKAVEAADGPGDEAAATERHRAMHEAVVGEAHDLGRACADDPTPFEPYWPELFGPTGHQSFFFGEGLAAGSRDLHASWTDLCERYRNRDASNRHASLLGGFLAAAAAADREAVERVLDEAIRDPVLGPVFPYLQQVVAFNAAGMGRLLIALDLGLAPSSAYLNLAYGRTTQDIPPCDLSQLLLRLARLPEGQTVAVEILAMHFHNPQPHQLPWDASLLKCGRRLLLDYPLDDPKRNLDYKLRRIAEQCLVGPDATADARALCEKMRDVAKTSYLVWRELKGLVECLLALHPRIALTCWLGGGAQDWDAVIYRFVAGRSNPLSEVPATVLLEWARAEPVTRYRQLAAVVPLVQGAEEDDSVHLSASASALLESAPDRAAIFEALVIERIQPSACSGSRADALERRRTLIRRFKNDDDPSLRRMARRVDTDLEADIRRARADEAQRDERFE